MTKFSFKNPFNQTFDEYTQQATNAQQGAIQKQAGAIFADKPHALEYKPIYNLSRTLKAGANLISIGTCIVGLYIALSGLFNFYFASLLSVSIATAFELLKNKLWTITAKQRLRYRKTAILGVLGLVCLHSLSIGASVFGAYHLSQFFHTTHARAYEAQPLVNVDSINNQYQQQLRTIDTQIGELSKMLSSSTNRRTINNLGRQKESILTAQKTALDTAKAQNRTIATSNARKAATAKAEHAQRLKTVQYSTVGVTLFFELVYILCAMFVISYLFRAFVDGQATSNDSSQRQTYNGNRNDSRTPPEPNDSEPHHDSTNSTQKGIGFDYPNKDKQNSQQPEPEPLEWTRICENSECKKKYIHKVHNQRFCTTDCRITSWERKTGKKLRKGAK